MRCPFCGNEETPVKDSRSSDDGSSIRRRRSCTKCMGRFTTFERVQLRDLVVMKKDESKEPFDRDKMAKSIQIALRKRPVSIEQVDLMVNSIIRQLESLGDNEVTTFKVGELIMESMADLDPVGYVRYASVYQDFRHPSDFNAFIQKLRAQQSGKGAIRDLPEKKHPDMLF